ncbi:hypothetical protein SP41_136 [Salmonella phage 41]|nr:hypothetical protein SP41_136 [Salmonella phage 41]
MKGKYVSWYHVLLSVMHSVANDLKDWLVDQEDACKVNILT